MRAFAGGLFNKSHSGLPRRAACEESTLMVGTLAILSAALSMAFSVAARQTYAVAIRTRNRAHNAIKDALPTGKPAFDE